jgi:putative phosphoribosyl transferase
MTIEGRALATESEDVVGVAGARLPASLAVPSDSRGIVVFAHGSGSSRVSPRNRFVASFLNEEGIATLLFDLLTPDEAADRRNVFDVELLAERLAGATRWLPTRPELRGLPLGFFGASTGAAAALWAAADLGDEVAAVVSRGGRPDLAASRLPEVTSPTLLVVGAADTEVLELNRAVLPLFGGEAALRTVPGATHLFEEPGALEQAASLARDWFSRHLGRRA